MESEQAANRKAKLYDFDFNTVYLTGDYLDILAISCDSFDNDTNDRIGRGQGNKGSKHVDKLYQIHDWCKEYKVAFKINTVVNTFNIEEDMTERILSLNPIRWKVRVALVT